MKELYFVHLFNDLSGSPRVLRDAIDCEVSNKEQKYLFTSGHEGFLSGANCNFIKVPYKRSSNKFLVLFYFLVAQLFTFFCLSRYLLKAKVKRVETQVIVNTILPFGAALSGKLFATKVVYYVHETYLEPKPLDTFLKFILRFSADEAIFVSDYVKSQYEKVKCPKKVILNGLRGDFSVDKLTSASQKFENKTVLFVGSFKRYKGVFTFFELAKRNPHINFVAALNCDDESLSEQSEVQNLKVLIRPANLPKLYNDATLLVNLSDPEQCIETFGLTIIEGFAYATPAIIPPVGGPCEFTNPKNAIQINSRDIGKLNEAVNRLTSDFDLWSAMSINAQETSKDFTTAQFQSRVAHYFAIGYTRPN